MNQICQAVGDVRQEHRQPVIQPPVSQAPPPVIQPPVSQVQPPVSPQPVSQAQPPVILPQVSQVLPPVLATADQTVPKLDARDEHWLS